MEVRLLEPGDEDLLGRVANGVFDGRPEPELVRRILADPQHLLVGAILDGTVVGFASAVHYLNPDKPAELWINEVGVAPDHRRQGIASRLTRTLMGEGRRRGCAEAWLLTDDGNGPARALYAKLGFREPESKPVLCSRPLT